MVSLRAFTDLTSSEPVGLVIEIIKSDITLTNRLVLEIIQSDITLTSRLVLEIIPSNITLTNRLV